MNTLTLSNRMPRFTETQLRAYTVKVLRDLQRVGNVVTVSDEAMKAWIALTQKQDFFFSELTMIQEAIDGHSLGSGAKATSFEENLWSKKGSVQYSPTEIVKTFRDGSVEKIANAPIVNQHTKNYRPGTKFVLPIVVALFDIKKGLLRMIPSVDQFIKMYGGTNSTVNPVAANSIRRVVVEILSHHPQSKEIEQTGKTFKGLAFVDHFCSCIDYAPLGESLCLHKVILENLVRGIARKEIPATTSSSPVQYQYVIGTKGKGIDAQTLISSKSVTVLPESLMKTDEDKKAYAGFVLATKQLPVLLCGPIKDSQNFWSSAGADFPLAVTAHKEFVTAHGGNKRGIGRIAEGINFQANQSENVRQLNLICSMLYGCAHKGYTMVDIKVPTGLVAPLFAWVSSCSNSEEIGWRLLIDVESKVTIPKMAEEWVIYKKRDEAILLWVDTKTPVPDVSERRGVPELLLKEEAMKYIRMLEALSPAGFVVFCPIYSGQFWSHDYEIHRLRYNHNLKGIITTLKGYALADDLPQYKQMDPEFSGDRAGPDISFELDDQSDYDDCGEEPDDNNSSKTESVAPSITTTITTKATPRNTTEVVEKKAPAGPPPPDDLEMYSYHAITANCFVVHSIQCMRALNIFWMHPTATFNRLGSIFQVGGSNIQFSESVDGWMFHYDSMSVELPAYAAEVIDGVIVDTVLTEPAVLVEQEVPVEATVNLDDL